MKKAAVLGLVILLGGCANLSTQEWNEKEYDKDGNVIKETTLKLNASNLRNKMALDANVEVALLDTEKEIAEVNARSCQRVDTATLNTWGVGDREQYFKYQESCANNPVMQVAWLADEMAENIREAAGESGPTTKIAQEFADVQKVHEQTVASNWRVGGGVLTAGFGIWGAVTALDNAGKHAGNTYGNIAVEASNSGGVTAGGPGGPEGGVGGSGTDAGGGRSQVLVFGDGNTTGASGAGPGSAATGKNVFQQAPLDSSQPNDFNQSSPFIDDSGDGGGNTLGF